MLDNFIEQEFGLFLRKKYSPPIDPTFIPIHLRGGIGDVIALSDMVSLLAERYQVLVYTEHSEALKYFCPKLLVKKKLPDYTWYLEIDNVARLVKKESFRGFLIKDHEDLFRNQQAFINQNSQIRYLIDQDRKYFLISKYAKSLGLNKRSFPLYSLGFPEVPQNFPMAFKPRVSPSNIITIHDGIDGSQIISGRATKQWKWSHWNELVRLLKAKFPGHKIIQLGAKTSREIDGVHECLINKTTITEAFDILSTSLLHVDGDSGLVHAATRMQIPCVVLWGPTPM